MRKNHTPDRDREDCLTAERLRRQLEVDLTKGVRSPDFLPCLNELRQLIASVARQKRMPRWFPKVEWTMHKIQRRGWLGHLGGSHSKHFPTLADGASVWTVPRNRKR